MSELRGGAAGGLAFVLLSVASAPLLPQPPTPRARAHSVLAYFAGHENRVVAASVLAAVAALALLLFFGALRERLAADRAAGRVVAAGGCVVVTVGLLGAVAQAALARGAARLGASDGLLAAFTIERALFYLAPAFAVSVVALAAARGMRRCAMPGWLAGLSALLGVVALVVGVIGVASTAKGATVAGFVGFLLTVVWTAATSVTLIRERPRGSTTVRDAAVAV